MVVDRAREYLFYECSDLELLAPHIVKGFSWVQMLQVQPRLNLDEFTGRRGYVEQLVEVLPWVDFEQQDPSPARRQPLAEHGGDRSLAHTTLAGDDDELKRGKAIEHGSSKDGILVSGPA
jgi:hypothetical protein